MPKISPPYEFMMEPFWGWRYLARHSHDTLGSRQRIALPLLSKSCYEYPRRQVPHVASQSPPFPSPILLPLKVIIESWKYWREAIHLGVRGETKHLTALPSQILSDKPLKPHRWFLLRNSPFFHSLSWALRLLLWQQPVLLRKTLNLKSWAVSCPTNQKIVLGCLGLFSSQIWFRLGLTKWIFKKSSQSCTQFWKKNCKSQDSNSKIFGTFSPLPYPGKNDPILTCTYVSNGLVGLKPPPRNWHPLITMTTTEIFDNGRGGRSLQDPPWWFQTEILAPLVVESNQPPSKNMRIHRQIGFRTPCR